ncbi:MAG: class I poly(R)-hydroxyalkanoic acid synthase, partial [Geminicoccaceae bacterium]|nr:class I poly(R)-hydroxyalkanoic acid synthase [Geminicoccaceae bacterium]
MDKQQQAAGSNPEQLVEIMSDIAQRSQSIVEEFVNRQTSGDNKGPSPELTQLSAAFMELTARMMSNPAEMMRAQFGLWQDYMRLWQSTAQRMMGQDPDPVIAPDRGDRRFKDPAWNDNLLFDFIKQSYLLSSRYVLDAATNDDHGLDDKTQQKVEFYTRQFVDALAPSNFVMT